MEEIKIKFPQQTETINEDYLFKIIVLGDCAVGKSNILSKFCKNIFNKSSKSTIGVELFTKFYKYDNKTKIQYESVDIGQNFYEEGSILF